MRSDNLRAKKAKRKKTGIILLLFIIVLILSAVIFVLKDLFPFRPFSQVCLDGTYKRKYI